MDVREKQMNFITDKLSYLQTKIRNRNSLNLTDINIHAENFFRDFFDKMGDSFSNTNFDSQNAAHIDLIDPENKRAIQITSQNDNQKITQAIEGFYKDGSKKDYKLQVLLISKDAKNYSTDFTSQGKYPFNHKEDVIDIRRLLAKINNEKVPVINSIARFLEDQIVIERRRTESKEVETIMALIDYLSDDQNRQLIDRVENVDPEKKFYKRFAEHSDFIEKQYQMLFTVYNTALLSAQETIDAVEAIIISSYLQSESDQLLTQNNNDPKAALNDLVEYFYTKLSENAFESFDKQAIRYYLLDEMIKCNVFPNQ